MGSGKTSIARLVDYCLGGDLELSPALQTEFVAATLTLEVGRIVMSLERQRAAEQVRATWVDDKEPYDVVLPARRPAGEVMPGLGVEVLSDLVFHLGNVRPPRVRRSKNRDDSPLERLSLRDLLWYCYLDQDNIDSDFFHLGAGSDQFKRLKSREVLRFVMGFHQERVTELESELESLRFRRVTLEQSAQALQEALTESGTGTQEEIDEIVAKLHSEHANLREQIIALRNDSASLRPSASEDLQTRGRELLAEIGSLDTALVEVREAIERDRRHLHEIEVLGLKIKRSTAARAVLEGLEFQVCPRCAQDLPSRADQLCPLCGQVDRPVEAEAPNAAVVDQDAESRKAELRDVLARRESQVQELKRRLGAAREEHARVDRDLTEASREYDSTYLSRALLLERRSASIAEQVTQWARLRQLPARVVAERESASALLGRENELRRELSEVRSKAEGDLRNLNRLGQLFLDCLLRARVPGIQSDDRVIFGRTTLLPEIQSAEAADTAVTSFANLSSGGKKTLFKCCFAVALHRLAVEIDAVLPTMLIVDSPMKNISERENRKQFEGFHELLYDLKAGELADTQFVLIDKEFCPPTNPEFVVVTRHMTPDDSANPPLIPYYRGH